MGASSRSRRSFLRDAAVLLGIGVLSVTIVLLLGNVVNTPNYSGHAAFHLLLGIPLVLLGVGISRLPPARERVHLIARGILLIALLLFGLAQLLEAIGAFGFEGLHDLGAAPSRIMGLTLPVAVLVLIVAHAVGALNLRVAEVLCGAIITLFVVYIVLAFGRII